MPAADVGLIGWVAIIFTGSPRFLHTVSTPSPSARGRDGLWVSHDAWGAPTPQVVRLSAEPVRSTALVSVELHLGGAMLGTCGWPGSGCTFPVTMSSLRQ
jgi:hypothetical protein